MKASNYTILIHKRLMNQLSTTETKQLNDWLATDLDHQIIADNIEKVWIWSQSKVCGFEPDVEGALDKLKARIAEDRRQNPPVKRFVLASFVRYAAAAAVVFALGFWYISQQSPSSAPELMVIHTAENETKTVELPDGSITVLNENSSLAYSIDFSGSERVVDLKGEGFFDIIADPSKPFLVETNQGTVAVLGTSFNVLVDPKGQTTTVAVASGKVGFRAKGSSDQILLNPDEKVIFNNQRKTYITVMDDTHNDWAWKTGDLNFRGQSLKTVIPIIEKHFDIDIQLENKELYTCRTLSGSFKDATVEDVFNSMALTLGMELNATQNKIYFFKGGDCE